MNEAPQIWHQTALCIRLPPNLNFKLQFGESIKLLRIYEWTKVYFPKVEGSPGFDASQFFYSVRLPDGYPEDVINIHEETFNKIFKIID